MQIKQRELYNLIVIPEEKSYFLISIISKITMKKINTFNIGIVLLISFIILNSCSNQRIPIPKEQPNRMYKGKIKKITTYSCQTYLQDGENIKILQNGCSIEKIEEFDEKEILLSEIKFDNPRDKTFITGTLTTVRDDKENIIEKTIIDYYYFKNKTRYEYKYNDSGFLVEEIQYNDDKFYTRSTYVFDKYNCLIEENYFNDQNQLKYRYISIF